MYNDNVEVRNMIFYNIEPSVFLGGIGTYVCGFKVENYNENFYKVLLILEIEIRSFQISQCVSLKYY